MTTPNKTSNPLAASHGSELLTRLYNHRATMTHRQKELHTGKLLIDCISELERLNEAIRLTLEENCHLADGDNCTLLRLKLSYEPNASDQLPRP